MSHAAFTHAEYRSLVERTREKYPCRGFEVLGGAIAAGESFCIIRHDIDLSPRRALELARIEAELGVRATYTVLTSGEFYNPFERRYRAICRDIADLGHSIGLHFDAAWHGIEDEAALEEAISWEAETLRRVLGTDIEMFSFHNTTPFTMSCQAPTYGGLWNAYASALQREVSYLSDSNGLWRFRSWAQGLDEHPPRLQVLTHPEWWTPAPATPAEKVCEELEERSRDSWAAYCDLVKLTERENVGNVSTAFACLPRYPGGSDLLRRWLAGYHRTALVDLVELVRQAAPASAEVVEACRVLTDIAGRLASGARGYSVAELAKAFDSAAALLPQKPADD